MRCVGGNQTGGMYVGTVAGGDEASKQHRRATHDTLSGTSKIPARLASAWWQS